MSEMVDEVAKHIYRSHRVGSAFDITTGKPIPDEEDTLWMLYRPMAKSAIEAMRDPLHRMTVAGHAAMDETAHTQTKALGSYMGRLAFVDVWKAMIDEALK